MLYVAAADGLHRCIRDGGWWILTPLYILKFLCVINKLVRCLHHSWREFCALSGRRMMLRVAGGGLSTAWVVAGGRWFIRCAGYGMREVVYPLRGWRQAGCSIHCVGGGWLSHVGGVRCCQCCQAATPFYEKSQPLYLQDLQAFANSPETFTGKNEVVECAPANFCCMFNC